jgi:DNA polymerase-3 subunit gamma/tau
MENFIVSARKYRPATFDTVVGQNNITSTLKNAIKNQQLAQAFLFTGPRGVGKTTCARILAKTINCMNLGEDITACNECESCISFNNSASFNIHELDAASNNSVEDIRNLVDQVRIPPQVGKYKVYIIDEVHMLSQSAFNAFLKTLEEPPAYAKFILATTEKHKIIPTILSRCQIYDFRRITVPDTIEHLKFVAAKENVEADPVALNVIAQKADGAMRDALSIFDQLVSFAGSNLTYDLVRENLNVLDYEYYFKITGFFLAGDISNTLVVFDEILESGFDGQHFIAGLGSHLRDLLVCKDAATIQLMEVGETIGEYYRKQAADCPMDFLLKGLNIIQKTDFTYKSSNNKRLHIEIALMQLASISAGGYFNETESTDYPISKKKTEIAPALQAGVNTPKTKQPVLDEVQATSDAAIPKPVTPAPTSIPVPAPTPTTATESPPTEKKDTGPTIAKKPAVGGIRGRTISLKDDPKEVVAAKPKEEYFDFASEEFKNAKQIELTDLEKAWEVMVNKIAVGRVNLQSTLSTSKPRVGDNFQVVFDVKNAVQEKEIDTLKNEIVNFLRQRLDNRFVRLQVIVNPDIQDARPYLPADIFKHMAEKNPAIVTLKEKFGLEPE